ncbi:MAG: glycoside hydrolase family 2 [Lachnospiraceae bacterium]|nr:glycoside hydrolase family 2 [Lachnospiraceae bacterium]
MKCYQKDYPRPQFVRRNWENLNGLWDFAFDDSNKGEQEKWYNNFSGSLKIQVPFTYESALSGIHDNTPHNNIWYHRIFHVNGALLQENNYILHFEGCDFHTKLWINGEYAGCHSGGYARFSFDVTNLLKDGENHVTVKVEDSFDLQMPRGKQRWKDENYGVFYVQTTGIWKTVWSEYVPQICLSDIKMTPNLQDTRLELEACIQAPAEAFDGNLFLETTISFNGYPVSKTCIAPFDNMNRNIKIGIDLHSEVSNTDEPTVKTWSPEHPDLYDIEFRILKNGAVLDQVGSYFAMRDIRIEGCRILLNRSPLYQRLLLDQGYWKDSLLTPPCEEAIWEDIEKILAMGFNGVRKHQKIEDERFLYWCDVKGLLVWSEMAAAFLYSDSALSEFTREWLEIVRQNYNHPCIITWTPFNESWGITNIKKRRDQQCFVNAIYYLTKSIDPIRPVITNDGWEHTISDIITIHDYGQDADALKNRWSEHKNEILNADTSPDVQRAAFADGFSYQGQPVIISEYGGIAIDTGVPGWGNMVKEEEFVQRFESITTAIRQIPYVCGYCYTQVTDVQQEINGLMDMDRNFKADPEIIRRINTQPVNSANQE